MSKEKPYYVIPPDKAHLHDSVAECPCPLRELWPPVEMPPRDYWTLKEKLLEQRNEQEQVESTACEIEIMSRYNSKREIKEMTAFVEAVHQQSLAPFVKSVFYDGQSDCCSFTLADDVEQSDPVAYELLVIARETIGQFEWFGGIEHGKPLEEY